MRLTRLRWPENATVALYGKLSRSGETSPVASVLQRRQNASNDKRHLGGKLSVQPIDCGSVSLR